MPIKFRCPHCSQFLGISRASAGSVVDCPACGRTLRVPQIDGRVDPLPAPKLDLADESLLDALDQLGGLGTVEEGPKPFVLKPAVVEHAAPVPAPQPIVIEALPPQGPTSAGTEPSIERDPLATLATSPVSPSSVSPSPLRAPTRRDIIVALGTAACVWPLGWWLGRSSRPKSVAGDAAVAKDSPAAVPPTPAEAGKSPPAPPSPDPARPALVGRMTYVGADGESRPDAGARILAFPETRAGASRLSVVGFRTGASEADRQLASESLKLLGGAYAIADAEGRYQLSLTSSGPYYLLMISRYQAREGGGLLPPELSKVLGEYFESGAPLIGQTQFSFTRFRYLGREAEPRDHVFQRS